MEENVSTANRVFLVEQVREIEDYYRVPRAVKVFASREVAQAWVDAQVEADARVRAAVQRVSEINAEWIDANPFVFEEPKPPGPRKWPSGVRQQDITPEMRAEREEQKKVVAAYFDRYRDAHDAWTGRQGDNLRAVWAAEGWSENLDDLPSYVSDGPAEYVVREMPVCETVEDADSSSSAEPDDA